MNSKKESEPAVNDGGGKSTAPKDQKKRAERKKSRVSLDLEVEQAFKLPDPDPAKPENDDSKRTEENLLEVMDGKKLKSKVWQKKLDLDSMTLNENEELDVKGMWKGLGRIPLVATAIEIKLGYSDFNQLQECENFVCCRKLSFQGCDFENTDFTKAQFPKLLQELDVSESCFHKDAYEALGKLEYFTTLIASGMDEGNLPAKGVLPQSVESIDMGASEGFTWDILEGLDNLKKVDLHGLDAEISGKCPLPTDLEFFDVDETDFDDIDFLKKLSKDCELKISSELRSQLQA